MRVLYFAYGSNMLKARLCSRIGSVKAIGRAFLKDKKVLFNKRSVDGSGKANLVASLGDVTWGVLYEISVQDLDTLDKVESGYDRISVQVWDLDGNIVEAVSYVSTNLTDDPVACKTYKELVVAGAREHNLPQDYIDYLERLPAKSDRTKSETAG